MRKLLLATALLLLPALALAAENPWLGTWKLNVAKSKFSGGTFTITKLENGLHHFSDGSTTEFDFGIDGKEYPTGDGYSVIWTTAGDNAWDLVGKLNGKVVVNQRVQISADGKTLNLQINGTKPDGSPFHDEIVHTRMTGTTGLVGKWKSTKVNISVPDTMVVSSPSEGVLRWEYPHDKATMEGKLDGTDLPSTGPQVPDGVTQAFKVLSPGKLSYTVKVKGKTEGLGVQTLSGDGKTLTDVSWSPGKESEKSTAVYEKQ